MPGWCGKCRKDYKEHGLDHIDNCDGEPRGVVSGSLEDYHQQTGDTGLLQAPEGSIGTTHCGIATNMVANVSLSGLPLKEE